MRLVVLLFGFIGIGLPFTHFAEPKPQAIGWGVGNQFYDNCAPAAVPFTERQTVIEKDNALFCLGYVEGLTHGIMAADIKWGRNTFCYPSAEVTNVQVVRIRLCPESC